MSEFVDDVDGYSLLMERTSGVVSRSMSMLFIDPGHFERDGTEQRTSNHDLDIYIPGQEI